MSLTAGTISLLSVQSNTSSLSATAASGGTGPYTQQWYRSTTTGFSPGGGNILTGQTSLTLSDSGLIPNTLYYYKVVYTDTGNSNATVTATQLAVTTTAPSQTQNPFVQTPFIGQVDLKIGPTNVVGAQIDSSQASALYSGSAVNVVNSADGAPKVVGSATDADSVFGFIVYDIKSPSYTAGLRCEVALAGTCMWLYATTAIARGAQVVLDLVSPGSVQAATGGTTDTIVGWAYDKSPGYGNLIRVILSTPSFTLDG